MREWGRYIPDSIFQIPDLGFGEQDWEIRPDPDGYRDYRNRQAHRPTNRNMKYMMENGGWKIENVDEDFPGRSVTMEWGRHAQFPEVWQSAIDKGLDYGLNF